MSGRFRWPEGCRSIRGWIRDVRAWVLTTLGRTAAIPDATAVFHTLSARASAYANRASIPIMPPFCTEFRRHRQDRRPS
jgi:hypothetical protein